MALTEPFRRLAEPLRPLADALKRLADCVWRGAQAVLLPPCLVAAYFIGLGLTWLAAVVLRKGPFAPDPATETFWKPVEDSDSGEDDFLRQS